MPKHSRHTRSPSANGGGSVRRSRLLLGVLVLACAVLVALFGSTIAIQLSSDREERLRAARSQVSSLSQALEAHLQRAMKSVDLDLTVMERLIEDRLPVASLGSAISQKEIDLGADLLEEVRAFGVLDRTGRVVAISRAGARREFETMNFSHRAYFRRHQEGYGESYIVDGPFGGGTEEGAYLTMSRRIDGPDGSFVGVAVAAIYLQDFSDFYATLEMPEDAVVALFERDGTFLLRYPDPGQIFGLDFSDRPLFTEHLPAASQGTYLSPPQSDGTVRITGYREIEEFGLVVAVAFARDQVLAGWWQRLSAELLLFLLFFAVLLAAVVYGVLQYRRLALSNSRYRDANRRRAEYQREQRAVLDAAPANIAILDPDGTIIEANEAWRRFARENAFDGSDAGVGENYLEVCRRAGTATPEAKQAAAGLSAVLERRQAMAELEYPCHSPTEQRWYRVIFSPLPSEAGGAIATHVDITDRKQAELVLRRHARKQQSIAELGQLVLERDGIEAGLERTSELASYAIDDAESITLYQLDEQEDELVRVSARGSERPQRLARTGHDAPEWRAMTKGETLVLPVSMSSQASAGAAAAPRIAAFVPIRRSGQPWGVLTVGFGFSESPGRETLTFLESMATILGNALTRRAEQRLLRENESFLTAVLDNMGDALVTYDETGYITRANRAAHKIFGYDPGGLIGRPIKDLVPTDLREEQLAAFRKHLRQGLGRALGELHEFEGLRSDGSRFPVELVLGETNRDGRRFFIGLLRDLTDANRLEAQLRQWQRLDAVGQLTGGIAHDFNNLLTVILGNAELLSDDLLDEAEREASLDSIISASENAVELTSRLLAFARRQPLAPASFDMNHLVRSMETLLRRTVPEDIEIELDLSDDLNEAQADRGQLENAILNLVVNARDAIGSGGRIHIQTGNAVLDAEYCRLNPDVRPGQYVMVAVSDDGEGMSSADVERAFEPFFTTKEAGRGTGLGLSMVYGFARQSGGHAKIYSEVGHGTTVRIYLPRASGPADGAEESAELEEMPLARPGETVLVVEDNPQVRAYALQLVRSLGYEVLEASDGVEALGMVEGDSRIDLVFTDMVMPGGLTGAELATQARRIRPGLPVLCTSGYAEGMVSGKAEVADSVTAMLSKPYRREELAVCLRELIDRGHP